MKPRFSVGDGKRTPEITPLCGALVRFGLLLAVIAMSGCVSEFLGPPTTTTRTVTCAVLSDMPVVVEHHGDVPAGGNAAVAAWFAVMADATGTSVDRFSSQQGMPIDDDNPIEELEILGRATTLHILWEAQAEDTMTMVAPGVLQINVTAIDAAVADGADRDHVVRGILFHGLGHTLGVVNNGIPRYDAGAHDSEMPGHHEAGGVMTGRWHKVDDLPADADRYPESVVRDWENAAADPRICP